ncbi:acyltransferase family protein [Limnobaculum parvum]|uniref:Acyltransferase n=1 Tax=Limnobaculum parvum TaxID=2172103 RepID=A0A2Y9TTY8_9GAMM|nr:acyltransferase family protein [Limnobaculum parvum]AWH87157.1 acyltransferase [Limnobaculum parvum]
MEFRKDINGLRAIAILGVLVFHFNHTLLPGGFAGVDVFFVISGFLMTKIIFSGCEKETFSLTKFYAARCRRIIPALLTLCVVLLIFGWFYLAPNDYRLLSLHSGTSLLFISNIIYWNEASYFAVDSFSKWLLHTWSLSVEWQFYLIYPLIVIFARNIFGLAKARSIVMCVLFVSFSLCLVLSPRWPSMSFYLIPTRAWEMIIGGVAYLYNFSLSQKQKKYTELAGLLLIVLSYTLFSNKDTWPSMLTTVPVLGALMVIIANNNNSFFTSNYFFQKIGSASYSIYLWHWPIVVLLYTNSMLNDYRYVISGMLASLVAGFFSYMIIENKSKSFNLKYILSCVALVIALFSSVWVTYGADVSARSLAQDKKAVYPTIYSPDKYFTQSMKDSFLEKCNFYDAVTNKAKEYIDHSCVEKKGIGGVFVWGDSHAQALGQGIRSVFKDLPFYQVASSSCKPGIIPDTETKGEVTISCDRSNKEALSSIANLHPDIVIMAQRAHHDLNDYDAIIQKLKEIRVKKIIIVGPITQYDIALPAVIAARHWNKSERMFADVALNRDFFQTDAKMQKKYNNSENVEYISLLNKLCKGDICLAKVDDNNTPIVWDYGHMTPEGSAYVSKMILKSAINE